MISRIKTYIIAYVKTQNKIHYPSGQTHSPTAV